MASKINAIDILIPVVFSDLAPTKKKIRKRPINSVKGRHDLKAFTRNKMQRVNDP